jgi:hypothetical protein
MNTDSKKDQSVVKETNTDLGLILS